MPKSNLYLDYLEMRNEIEKHKWIESEKMGYDVGFDHALIDWTTHHRKNWVEHKKRKNRMMCPEN